MIRRLAGLANFMVSVALPVQGAPFGTGCALEFAKRMEILQGHLERIFHVYCIERDLCGCHRIVDSFRLVTLRCKILFTAARHKELVYLT
jgi:hypothetical protein